MSSGVCEACEHKVDDDYPEYCPRCERRGDTNKVEERCYGVRCSWYMCMWKRWWNDKLPMDSPKMHEESDEEDQEISMTTSETPDTVEQFRDQFDARSTDDEESFDSDDCWISDDGVLTLIPDGVEPLARGMIANMEVSPERSEEKEYTNDDDETYLLVEIEHESTHKRSDTTVKHYYQKQYLEQIADAFDLDFDEALDALTSRFDRGSTHPAKVDLPESEYCVVISPFRPTTPQLQ